MFFTRTVLIFLIHNWAWCTIGVMIALYIVHRSLTYSYGKYVGYIQNIHGYILIGGAFSRGKTRLLALLAREARHIGQFVITNFANGYNHLRFSSIKDFQLLLEDIMIISEYQNHSDTEIMEVYDGMGDKYIKNKKKERDMIRRKYPYIPFNGRITEFFLAGDEWHAYFFARAAMSNFSGDAKGFNTSLHQVRHFNVRGIFATQEIDDLDKKFRTLATYEIDTYDKLGGAFMGWTIYRYNGNKKYNEEEKTFLKVNRLPIITPNGYIINKWVYKINFKFLDPLSKRLDKWGIKVKMHIDKVFYQLKFFSKSNVNPTLDIYDSGKLFYVLNEYYKAEVEPEKPITKDKKKKFDKVDK